MEPGDPSKTASEPPTQGWAGILGIAIAVLTLVIPTLVIAYYSSPSPKNPVLRTTLPQTRPKTRTKTPPPTNRLQSARQSSPDEPLTANHLPQR
ncbi:MAG: hypothetical protein AB4290_02405 [Spirulina sp.]